MKCLKKSIYLLPNLFTTGNLLCGFASIVASINGQYWRAACAILIAVCLDYLDGKVARMTNSASAFGLEYDSLADLLSFGMAPGLLLYAWALRPFGPFGWLVAFLFVICGALRLARFNVQVTSVQKYTFTGLPIPAAAGVIASAILLSQELHGDLHEFDTAPPVFLMLAVCALALLMVSHFKYRSFKHLRLKRVRSLHLLGVGVLAIIVIILNPEISLFLLFFIYAISGPLETLLRRRKSKEEVLPVEQ
jgi:CDP-diacylglycerol--serine O-phosphatidyltransferase